PMSAGFQILATRSRMTRYSGEPRDLCICSILMTISLGGFLLAESCLPGSRFLLSCFRLPRLLRSFGTSDSLHVPNSGRSPLAQPSGVAHLGSDGSEIGRLRSS